MADPRVKQIRIKTGVVSRLVKEKLGYQKEAVQLEEKLEKLKTDGTDEYVVKKQSKEVDLAESEEYVKAKEILATAAPHVA